MERPKRANISRHRRVRLSVLAFLLATVIAPARSVDAHDACRSFEASIKNCEKKAEPPEHPLEESVGTTETYRRNF